MRTSEGEQYQWPPLPRGCRFPGRLVIPLSPRHVPCLRSGFGAGQFLKRIERRSGAQDETQWDWRFITWESCEPSRAGRRKPRFSAGAAACR
jgi:hypothetical protein